jgi:hypothetical protein
MRWWGLCASVVLATSTLPSVTLAQTADDSARVVLDAASLLERDGRSDLARELLQYLRSRWPASPAAAVALERMRALRPETTAFSRTGFIAYHTVFGAWLGIAVPAALGADDPEPFGAGLLLGAPLGFFGSRAYGRSRPLSEGQAGIIEFGSFWGTWQAFAWQSILDLGERTTCDFDVCFVETPATARWTAAVIGGVAGLGAGLLAGQRPIAGGTSSMIFHGALWGTWYGVAAGILAGAEDDERLTAAAIGGNAGLLLAIPLAHRWRPTSTQVRIASAGGLAGGLAGLGIVLLFNIDGEEGIIGTTAAGTTDDAAGGGGLGLAPALLSGDGRLRLGIPVPAPGATFLPGGGSERVWRVRLADVRF